MIVSLQEFDEKDKLQLEKENKKLNSYLQPSQLDRNVIYAKWNV